MRTRNSFTQEAFGALFGVTRDNIASYERGSEPRLDFIIRVAEYFRLTTDELINDLLDETAESGNVRYDTPSSEGLLAAEPQAPYRADGPPARQSIPIYELGKSISFAALLAEPRRFQPIDRFAAATLPRCDGGLRLGPGEGMAPVYQPGDIVFFRQVNDIYGAIVWGEAYLLSFELDGDPYTMIRTVHPSDRADYVRLSGCDPHHAPKEIALSQIRALASITGSLRVSSR